MNDRIVIGTRGSTLALWQANYVKEQLQNAWPDYAPEIRVIKTTGDELQGVALSKIGDKGLFTRQIENELLDGTIDIAVHSLKDLQTEQPDGLAIGAVSKREIPNDVLLAKGDHQTIADLPIGARVATGSLRRRCQLLSLRPDLEIVDIRGNVPTRIEKFNSSDIDALVLAYAGVHRLSIEVTPEQLIPVDIIVPAVGQGAVAIEIRSMDARIASAIAPLHDSRTASETTAERAFLRRLEGGCQVPIGGLAIMNDGVIHLTGIVGSLDGKTVFKEHATAPADRPEQIGTDLAERLIDMGADAILASARAQMDKVQGSTL